MSEYSRLGDLDFVLQQYKLSGFDQFRTLSMFRVYVSHNKLSNLVVNPSKKVIKITESCNMTFAKNFKVEEFSTFMSRLNILCLLSSSLHSIVKF
jgi:hypothetical protein